MLNEFPMIAINIGKRMTNITKVLEANKNHNIPSCDADVAGEINPANIP